MGGVGGGKRKGGGELMTTGKRKKKPPLCLLCSFLISGSTEPSTSTPQSRHQPLIDAYLIPSARARRCNVSLSTRRTRLTVAPTTQVGAIATVFSPSFVVKDRGKSDGLFDGSACSCFSLLSLSAPSPARCARRQRVERGALRSPPCCHWRRARGEHRRGTRTREGERRGARFL